jgi:21S rRNA (GM2251-2'-O)-methyltransferase
MFIVTTANDTRGREISELLIQTEMDLNQKKDSQGAKAILELSRNQLQIPIREFSKHDLNMLAENRPHQGFILRCQPKPFVDCLFLEKVSSNQ